MTRDEAVQRLAGWISAAARKLSPVNSHLREDIESEMILAILDCEKLTAEPAYYKLRAESRGINFLQTELKYLHRHEPLPNAWENE